MYFTVLQFKKMDQNLTSKANHLPKVKQSVPLKPLLNLKVDELFLKWISLPEQSYLFEQLQKPLCGDESEEEAKPINTNLTNHRKANSGDSPVHEATNESTKPMLSPRRQAREPKVLPNSMIVLKPAESKSVLDKPVVESPKAPKSPPLAVTARTKLSSEVKIPQFYFPNGEPCKTKELGWEKRVAEAFGASKLMTLSQIAPVCKACGCPLYWKSCLYRKALKAGSSAVSKDDIISMWRKVSLKYHDQSSRFIALLSKNGQNYVEFDDFLPLMRDVVDTHPGLMFLKEAPEFHTRYMNTVIARIFYTVNRSWTGKITPNELRRSNFLSILKSLETEQDINAVTDYFSYEHFYVIYCKFWELDTDHDLVIDSNDLARHGDGVLSTRLVSRITSKAVQRWTDDDHPPGTLSYVDFIWFLISEEDKTSKTSIEYWFRCMDLDGDGYISLYEMEYFYEEQIRKLELLDIEPLPFTDCVCSMLDMIRPTKPDCVSLSDLKRCGLAHIFFDTFLNVEKYLEHEQKDPFANSLLDGEEEEEAQKQTDWEKYAAEEYEVLVAEEQANEAVDALTTALDDDMRSSGIVSRFESMETSW